MAMLWSSEVLHLTEALTNFLEVVARFPESVAVAGLTGLLATEGKIAATAVGDSPEGPLKQPGESCLKPAKNRNKTSLT
jgi:hypothetical protein